MSAQVGIKKINAAAKGSVPQTTGLVYRKEAGTGKTLVGYFMNGEFAVLSRHDSRGAAKNTINALNGGTGAVFTSEGNLVARTA